MHVVVGTWIGWNTFWNKALPQKQLRGSSGREGKESRPEVAEYGSTDHIPVPHSPLFPHSNEQRDLLIQAQALLPASRAVQHLS